MQRLQAFKYELMPNGEQQRKMRCFAGSCRFVYNKALSLQNEWYTEDNSIKFSYVTLANLLPEWKKELPWLKKAPSQTLQQSLKNLERAYKNFFARRAEQPRKKKKGHSDSFRYPDPKQIKLDQGNCRIFLPKLGWIRYRNSRDVIGDIKQVTVSIKFKKWFVSIQTVREVEVSVHPSSSSVGVDMGIARFATLSDGLFVEPLNSFKKHEAALRKAQQSLSRKVKFSQDWKKAKHRVQSLYNRIADVRRDYLHKTSTAISKNHAIVCVEDLQVKNMSRSAKGTTQNPGKRVKAKSGLNKAILDQGWNEFRRQLEYKLAWNGGRLVAVPPQNTSRTCPGCGFVSNDNRKTQEQFMCVGCGFKEHADVVGAINILRAGLAQLACEASDALMSPAAGTHRSDSEVLHAV
ncbi:MAG: transposase [Syntrophorhabdaceae bacterium]|nr:transposase [Syntrophorhabdaceae bacterium]